MSFNNSNENTNTNTEQTNQNIQDIQDNQDVISHIPFSSIQRSHHNAIDEDPDGVFDVSNYLMENSEIIPRSFSGSKRSLDTNSTNEDLLADTETVKKTPYVCNNLLEEIQKALEEQGLTATKIFIDIEKDADGNDIGICPICRDTDENPITPTNFCVFEKCGHVYCPTCVEDIRQHNVQNHIGRHVSSTSQSVKCSFCQDYSRCVWHNTNNMETIRKSFLGNIPVPVSRTASSFCSSILNSNVYYGGGNLQSQHNFQRGDNSGILSFSPLISEELIEESNPTIRLYYSPLVYEGATMGVLGINVTCPSTTSLLNQDLILVIDKSGSMNTNGKLADLKKGIKECVSGLLNGIRLGIIAFDNDAFVVFPLETVTDEKKAEWITKIDNLRADGGTSYTSGLNLTKQMIDNAKITGPYRNIKVLVMGDGDYTQVAVDNIFNSGASLYGISIGEDVSYKLFEDFLRNFFQEGHYEHIDDNNVSEKFSRLGFLTASVFTNCIVSFENCEPDSSQAYLDSEDGIWKIRYSSLGDGIVKVPVKSIESISPRISITYTEDSTTNIIEATIVEPTQLNRKILEQLLRYRKHIMVLQEKISSNTITLAKLKTIKDSITEELYGENTDKFRNIVEVIRQKLESHHDHTSRNMIQAAVVARQSSSGVQRAVSGFN